MRLLSRLKQMVRPLSQPTVGTSNLATREAWLEKTLASIPNGNTILDAGAGELQYKRFCGHLKYTSQDFGQYDGQGNQEGLQTQQWDNSRLDIVSDIASMPVKDSSFDAVMCIEVFEHIPHPREALREFSRVLKPGGLLIITAPVCSLTHFAPYYFYNGFSKYFYQKSLSECGFEVEEISFNGNYFEYVAQELRRVSHVASEYDGKASRFGLISRWARWFLLRELQHYSKSTQNSEQLLCWGIHVVAKKAK